MNSDFSIAVHCVAYLAQKQNQRVTSEDISQSVSVHPVRLRKILSVLRKENIITSKEGAKGGFSLNDTPERITLDKIFKVTSEETLVPKCPDANENCLIGKHLSDILIRVFQNAEEHFLNYLKSVTIQDIIDEINQSESHSED
ncbi:RrF2 family transcriptional regulator [Bacillus alveayuensis]|jgi:Rrf2 family protein|uniref:Rrf2 family protein n=1 Tax=Aeribacillus alveayuensis TaxID=279215 RepID=A0ABT9VMB4_9BACI|nr:Rrf2 family transcriptional regulator [Bacillus alveayuensis]MDQ0162019.1 Rrf2 family protein [Bacillus alveayuensis]